MQSDMFIVSTINDIMWNLDTWHEKLDIPHETIDVLLYGRAIVSDAQRIQLTENGKIEQRMNKCQVVYPDGDAMEGLMLQVRSIILLLMSVPRCWGSWPPLQFPLNYQLSKIILHCPVSVWIFSIKFFSLVFPVPLCGDNQSCLYCQHFLRNTI